MTYEHAKTLLKSMPKEQVRDLANEYVHVSGTPRINSRDYIVALAAYAKQRMH